MTTTFSALGLTIALGQATAAPARALVCFGSYSTPDKESVHLFQLLLKNGSLNILSAVDGLKNPSFLKIHPNGKFLYTVNEVATFDGKRSGGVTAFALDVQAGKLTQLNQQPSGDTGPCHLTVDATGKFVLVAHYGGGSTSVLPIKKDGSVGAVVSQIKHKGSSVHSRQKAPHAHSIHVGPNNKFAFAPDLGIDKVLVFSFDEKTVAATLDTGDRISAATARRLACEAGIIPVVLGGRREVLDQGRRKRLFTRAQRIALATRDRGCTAIGFVGRRRRGVATPSAPPKYSTCISPPRLES